MSHPLIDVATIDEVPEVYLKSIGQITAVFGAQTQDSGNISYGVRVEGKTYFVKSAGHPNSAQSYFAHAGRIDLLRNAVHLRQSVEHETLPKLYNIIESPHGLLLVYEWVAGDLLRVESKDRNNPAQPHARFRHLPTTQITNALDRVYETHSLLAAAGWVAVDFYDGSLIYDFVNQRVYLIDLDHYHQGPFKNEMGRMFGSSRFMAPEEFEHGARIDERTTLFSLARAAALFLSDGTLDRAPFCAGDSLYQVVRRACDPDPNLRFSSVANFFSAWRQALSKN